MPAEFVFALLDLAVTAAVRLLRSTEEIGESDRATLAKAAELAGELAERKKFGG